MKRQGDVYEYDQHSSDAQPRFSFRFYKTAIKHLMYIINIYSLTLWNLLQSTLSSV